MSWEIAIFIAVVLVGWEVTRIQMQHDKLLAEIRDLLRNRESDG